MLGGIHLQSIDWKLDASYAGQMILHKNLKYRKRSETRSRWQNWAGIERMKTSDSSES